MLWHRLLPFHALATVASTLPSTVHLDGHQNVLDSGATTSTIRDVLLASKVIPQVLDDFEPTYFIDIAYPKHHSQVLLGNKLPVKSVSTRPVFAFHALAPPNDDPPNNRNLTFTLILTDPDALSYKHPSKSEMCHWIVTNLTTPLKLNAATSSLWRHVFDWEADLPRTERKNHDKKLANEIESYFPPAPPKKTGPHRYVFVLLEGDASNLVPPKNRVHWGYGKERHGVRDWSKENNLTVVGANYFVAQHKKQKHH